MAEPELAAPGGRRPRLILAAVLVAATLTGVFVGPRGVAEAGSATPNVLVIVTDDQRLAADTMAVMPKTSALFAQGGEAFPNYMVTTPLCCPSRSTIFSGRYAHNTGVLTNTDDAAVQAFDQRATIQAYLHTAGYQTGIAGKFFNTWPTPQDPPNFDRWAIFGGGYTDANFNVDGHVSRLAGYTTSVLTDLSIGFLRSFEADDARPWFLYVAPQAPHDPYTPDAPYVDAPVPRWKPGPAFGERNIGDKPPWVRWHTFSRAQANALRSAQLRTLMSADDMVQRLFDELDALGETRDTLAIFTSDNGYLWGEHRIGANKRFPYTESVEVPFYLRWPGHVAAGAVDDALVANVDILPTILDTTGVTPALRYPLDGRSLLEPGERRRLLLEYWVSSDNASVPSWASIRTAAFQYVEWYAEDGSVSFREYYDLRKDPYQLRNLLGDPDPSNDPVTDGLSARLAAYRTCQGAACP